MQTYNTFLTVDGLNQLKQRIQTLNQKRIKIGKALHESVEPGDRLENSSYVSTLEKKLEVENDLRNINNTISKAKIIRKPKNCSFVRLGSEVKVKGRGSVKAYTIVDSPEVNPNNGYISYRSPVGSSLMNKRVGDRVVIGGQKTATYTVLSIS